MTDKIDQEDDSQGVPVFSVFYNGTRIAHFHTEFSVSDIHTWFSVQLWDECCNIVFCLATFSSWQNMSCQLKLFLFPLQYFQVLCNEILKYTQTRYLSRYELIFLKVTAPKTSGQNYYFTQNARWWKSLTCIGFGILEFSRQNKRIRGKQLHKTSCHWTGYHPRPRTNISIGDSWVMCWFSPTV